MFHRSCTRNITTAILALACLMACGCPGVSIQDVVDLVEDQLDEPMAMDDSDVGPVDDQPADEDPADETPADERPADEQPADDDDRDDEPSETQVRIDVRFIVLEDMNIEELGLDFDQTIELIDDVPTDAVYGNDPLGPDGVVFPEVGRDTLDDVVEPLPGADSTSRNIVSLSAAVVDPRTLRLALRDISRTGIIETTESVELDNEQAGFAILSNESRTPIELSDTFRQALQGIDPLIASFNTGPTLEIVPRVSGDGNIIMDILPSRGGVFWTQATGEWRPLIQQSERRASATIADQETIILAGMTDVQGERVDGVAPLFANVPVVSRLIENREFVTDDSTLLIFITARLID